MDGNDIYAVSGRVKNHIARDGIALSPAGTILVNLYSLMLKDLYDFSDTLEPVDMNALKDLLLRKEGLARDIIKLTTPKGNQMSLYEEVLGTMDKPRFNSPQEALEHFTKEYEDLGAEYGMTGDEFWFQTENSSKWDEDNHKIMRLSRSIQMCRYLIEKEKKGG